MKTKKYIRIGVVLPFLILSSTLLAQINLEFFELKEEGHESYLLRFSPDNRLLASVGRNNEIIVWDVASKSSVNILEGHQDKISALAFSSDGLFLFSGDKIGKIFIWRINSGVSEKIIEDGITTITGLDYSLDGDYLIASDKAGNLYTFDLKNNFRSTTWGGHNKTVSEISFYGDDQYFASAGYDGVVKLWITASSKLYKKFNPDGGRIYCMSVTPNGNLLSISTEKKGVIIYDINTGYQYAALDPHKKTVLDMQFSADSKYLFSSGLDNQLRIYDDSAKVEVFASKDFYKIIRISGTQDGKYFAVADISNKIKVFDTSPLKIKPAKRSKISYGIAAGNAWSNDIEIEIVQPFLGEDTVMITSEKSYLVKGKVTSSNGIFEITVNDHETIMDENGYFEIEIRLPYGDWPVNVVVRDVKDNVAVKTFYTHRSLDQELVENAGRVGRDYALLIGSNDYQNFTPLSNPLFDINTLDQELRENYGFSTTVAANPTKVEFLSQIREFTKREYSDEDQLLIVVAGHGEYDDVFREGYIVNVDSKADDEVKVSYISYSNFRNIVNNIPCKHVLVILDVCFGGTFNPIVAQRGSPIYDEMERQMFIKQKLKYTTRKYITSGGKQYVPDGVPGHHSPFARRLLEAIRGDGLGDNILTFNELLTYLDKVKPDPQYGEFGINEPGSDFLFIRQ